MSSPSTALPPLIASTVRHGLTALAGVLVTKGFLTSTDGVQYADVGAGIVIGLIGYGWSLARAGKLGSQAQTIACLMDRLLGSVPVESVTVTAPPQAVDTSRPAWPVATTPDPYDRVKAFTTTPPQFTNNDQGNS